MANPNAFFHVWLLLPCLGVQMRLLILARLILRELETIATNSKGRQRFSCRHCFDQNTICTWAILWGLSGNFSWEDWCLENLVLPGIHRKHILSSQEHILYSKNPRISSDCFLLKSACTWKSWSRLQSCHNRSLVWRTQEIDSTMQPVSVSDAAEETKALSVVCQMTCGKVSDGVRTDSKDPGSLILTWGDFKNSAIPYSKWAKITVRMKLG